ncbi:YpmS family protein [Jeotgalibacillus haloalkalitolerans]|uniref:YpmS family protein n=1 Tax=Jeotgalibacillus haloalkalitolerans TaxID=3104292 RepID=A0ABU5KLJ2_9BACL|nr:YpmS family protein [Jeotgalibacillus sp. HH7-29]MDZ5711943.1 YpmS family protein [Jeotgalibacillus sp. HH7-29]
MRNFWKLMFFGLLSVILIATAVIAYLLLRPVEGEQANASQEAPPESRAEFEVITNREDLTIVANRFIEEELGGSIDYSVLFDDRVKLNGEIPIFSTSIDFQMSFEANALENGNLLLTQESLSLGAIDLPVSSVLKFIDDSYEFPEWVVMEPQNQQIVVQVTEIDVAQGLNVKTNQFDLEDDEISFSIYVPK